MNIYECMDRPNTIEYYGILAEIKKDISGIISSFSSDIRLRNRVSEDRLMRPYFRMRLLYDLCEMYEIFSGDVGWQAVHNKDMNGFTVYRWGFDTDNGDAYMIKTKCTDENIISICDKIVESYRFEIPSILKEFFK